MRIATLALLCSFAAAAALVKRATFKLSNEPFAGNPGPSALVHLAKGFKKTGPLNLIVHFHGIQNCVSSTVEASAGKCGAKPATAHNLIGQVDASGVNAAFVAVEVQYNKTNTDAGNLANDGFFGDLIDELLPKIGSLAGRNYTRRDIGKLVLTSHSGGYAALCESLAKGGVPVSAVLLFDSLYANPKKTGAKEDQCFNKYVDFVKGKSSARLAVVYTNQGGTKVNSQELAAKVKPLVDASAYWDERKKNDAQIMKAGELGRRAVFVLTGYVHDDSVRKYYAPMLGKLGL